MRALYVLVLVFAAAASSGFGGPIPITGTGVTETGGRLFDITGPGFSYDFRTGETISIIGQCVPGVPPDLTRAYSAGLVPPSPRFRTSISVDGVGDSTVVAGFLTFTAPPVVAGGGPGSVSAPIDLFGEISAYGPAPPGTDNYPEIFRVAVRGSGTGVFTSFAGGGIVQQASYTFSGTAQVVPEPAAALLVALGLCLVLGSAGVRWRRTRAS